MRVYHGIEAIIRGIYLVVIWYIFVFEFGIFLLLTSFAFFWIFFELLLNALLHKDSLFYVGNTSKIDRLAQRIFPRYTGQFLFAVKLILLTVFLILTP